LTLDEWVNQHARCQNHHPCTPDVNLERFVGVGLWHETPSQNHGCYADWKIHKKDCAPAKVKEVGLNDKATDDWTENSTEPKSWAVGGEGLAEFLRWEGLANQSEALR